MIREDFRTSFSFTKHDKHFARRHTGWTMRIDLDTCRDPDMLAAEVRRLQAVINSEATLTDAEREAIDWCIFQDWVPQEKAATLRGLLERTRG
jgi:hypothetical protein